MRSKIRHDNDLNSKSLDELLMEYNDAITIDHRQHEAITCCGALLIVGIATVYLAYVGTLPILGCLVILAALGCIGAVLMAQASQIN